MQTLYYTTSNFIRHTDNVVDLCEYRRKLERARSMSMNCDRVQAECPPADARPRAAAAARRGLMLDTCASLCIVVMTLTVTLHVLGL